MFLTDFGLAMDAELELDAEERAFLAAHRHYDDGAFILSLYRPATQLFDAWSEDTQRAVRARCGDTQLPTLLDHLDELADDGVLPIPPAYRDTLRRYREVLEIMHRVFGALRTGSKLQGGYDDDELRRALSRARLGSADDAADRA